MLVLTEAEARSARGPEHREFWDENSKMYRGEFVQPGNSSMYLVITNVTRLDVFHSLHCLVSRDQEEYSQQ